MPIPNDYPWSGALFVTHSLYSYNGERKFAFKSEALFGVMGPASLAGPTQRMVHRLINYRQPEGWSNQFGNTPLVNAAFSAEKQEWSWKNFIEVIGGARIDVGSLIDEFTVYQYVRIGIMNPYFDGLSMLRSITYTQKPITAYMKGLYDHNVGNITICKSW